MENYYFESAVCMCCFDENKKIEYRCKNCKKITCFDCGMRCMEHHELRYFINDVFNFECCDYCCNVHFIVECYLCNRTGSTLDMYKNIIGLYQHRTC